MPGEARDVLARVVGKLDDLIAAMAETTGPPTDVALAGHQKHEEIARFLQESRRLSGQLCTAFSLGGRRRVHRAESTDFQPEQPLGTIDPLAAFNAIARTTGLRVEDIKKAIQLLAGVKEQGLREERRRAESGRKA
jgi:hypothetical protein